MSGNIWKFSDQLDDADIAFARKEFITYREGEEYYGLSEKQMWTRARASGAIYKIDTKMVRVKRSIFEEYLRNENRRTD
ncbi:MAG: DUF6462 family protein [Lachnospiraceae bacterium]|jgi:hypothetical protein|nr:DUF6462 family protein [Lachnospiraceae bacterium]